MANMLNNINELVDTKYLITRSISNQAEAGTLVHIMAARKAADGFSLDYRVTQTGQNYKIEFRSMNDFVKWARSDQFISRNYDAFTKDEIMHYIKVTGRTFASFCCPLIIAALIIVWVAALVFLKGTASVIAGIIGSVVASLLILIIYKRQKSSVKMKMYYKLGTSKWGVKFK
ncbi:MAG: hypothetical protein ACI4RH_02905 [Huintestinicola sp.]